MRPSKHTPQSYAFFMLSRRDYGTLELKSKLVEKFGPEDAVQTIDFLVLHKFLDDHRFASNYVKSKADFKGKYYISQKLLQKGIKPEMIEKALKSYPEEKELESAIIMGKKYIAKKEGDANLYQKTGSFLVRKGFSYEIVKKVLNSIL